MKFKSLFIVNLINAIQKLTLAAIPGIRNKTLFFFARRRRGGGAIQRGWILSVRLKIGLLHFTEAAAAAAAATTTTGIARAARRSENYFHRHFRQSLAATTASN